MKTLPEEAVEALQGRTPVIAGAVKLAFGDTYRLWSGYGDLTIEPHGVFTGIGANALITPIGGDAGGGADGLKLTLSALDPDVAQSIEDEDYHQKSVTIWRLVFSPDHVLLGAGVFMRGRVDTIDISETVGGEAAINISVEGPRRDMNRSGARIAADADQRVLGGPGDASMKHIGLTARKVMKWGQHMVTGGGALNGGSNNGSNGNAANSGSGGSSSIRPGREFGTV